MEASAPLAGWWRRLVGYLIDSIIINIVSKIILLAVPNLFGYAIVIVMEFAYWIYFVSRGGQTLGMRIVRVRVIPSDGRSSVSAADALVRLLMMIVGGVCVFLGFLWAAWDPRRQAWHDHVARTIVVDA